MPSAPPSPRRSTSEDAALYIRHLIFDGDLRPGARVPQDEIASALGVSRIPVREALIALEREGWVTIELHRGAFVNVLDAQAVHDHYDLYGLVYGMAARRAVVRTDAAALAGGLSPLVRDVSATEEPAAFGTAAFAFHRYVIDTARSPRLKVVIRTLSALVPGDFFAVVPDAIHIERRSIPRIAQALKRGDGEAAAQEYESMMRRVGERVVDVLDRRGLLGAAA